jgi:hypothetical protein
VDGGDVADHETPGGDVERMAPAAVAAVDLADGDGLAVAGDDELFRRRRSGHGDLQREQRGIVDVGGEMGGDRAAHGRILVFPHCRWRVVPWSSE